MISPTNLGKGTMFMYHNEPYKVLEYTHTQVGRGGATIRVKSQNPVSGVIKDITFNSSDKIEEADVNSTEMQYLYSDENSIYFMDENTYEQFQGDKNRLENELKYLIEGDVFKVMIYKNEIIGITLPPSIIYKVTEASDAVKGNTSSNPTKKVMLENDLEIDVPMFIKQGDKIKINTSTGKYVNREN